MKLSELKLGFLDLETTGLQETIDRIVQFSCVSKRYNPRYAIDLDIIINPEIHVQNRVAAIHKLSDDVLSKYPKMNAKTFQTILEFLLEEVDVVVTFNGNRFDRPRLGLFLERHAAIYGVKMPVVPCLNRQWIDVYHLVRLPHFAPIFSGLTNLKMTTIAKKFGIGEFNAHNALADCEALSKIFAAMIDSDMIPDNYVDAISLQAGIINE